MSVQTALLITMYFYYTNKTLLSALFPVLYGGVVYVLVSGLTPMAVLVQLVSLQVAFIAISRVSLLDNKTSKLEGYYLYHRRYRSNLISNLIFDI